MGSGDEASTLTFVGVTEVAKAIEEAKASVSKRFISFVQIWTNSSLEGTGRYATPSVGSRAKVGKAGIHGDLPYRASNR